MHNWGAASLDFLYRISERFRPERDPCPAQAAARSLRTSSSGPSISRSISCTSSHCHTGKDRSDQPWVRVKRRRHVQRTVSAGPKAALPKTSLRGPVRVAWLLWKSEPAPASTGPAWSGPRNTAAQADSGICKKGLLCDGRAYVALAAQVVERPR